MSKLGILHNEFSITYRRNFELKTFKITILVLFSAACEAQICAGSKEPAPRLKLGASTRRAKGHL
jgi:hypothetical protein